MSTQILIDFKCGKCEYKVSNIGGFKRHMIFFHVSNEIICVSSEKEKIFTFNIEEKYKYCYINDLEAKKTVLLNIFI